MEYGLVALWFVAYALLALVGLPIASLLFERFPDRGATFALPISLTVLTLVAYWVGHVTFGPVAVGIAVVVLLVASGLAIRAGGSIHLRGLAAAMAVFGLAFGFMLAIRAIDPAVHPGGGEKFLDFGLIQTVLRADRLPPEDFWFAGERLRYYYGGFVMTALLSMLTDTPARYAYNLALAGFFASLVTAAYGLAGAIADSHGHSHRLAGALAALFVGVGGNLATPGRMLLGLLPDDLAAQYGRVLFAGVRGVPYEEALANLTVPKNFSYWYGRYVIDGTLNVFPLWSFLNGDLSAFMIAMTFLLGCVALSFAYYRTPETVLTRRRALVFVAFPPAVGLCALISTWSVPSAVGVLWLSLALGDARPATLLPDAIARHLPAPPDATASLARLRHELSRTLVATGVACAGGLAGAVLASPFLLFHSPEVRGVRFLPPRSGLGELFLVHGAFLTLFALYLVARRPRWLRARLARAPPRALAVVGVASVAVLAVLGLAVDLAAVALAGPFVVVGWVLCRTRADTSREPTEEPVDGNRPPERRRSSDAAATLFDAGSPIGYETVLIVAGAGLVLAVEFAYVSAGSITQNVRWKTVFKVYLQVWVLWGTAAGVALAWLLAAARDAFGRALAGRSVPRTALAAGLAVLAVTALVVPATGTFAGLALSAHFDDPPAESAGLDPTLDGTRFVEQSWPAQAESIAWLDNRSGQPNIVTEPGTQMYTWTSAPATLTGVPTVIGWRHERGYRGAAAFEERVAAVNTIYTEPWSAGAPVLDRYDVRYIYVGPPERDRYGDVQNYARQPNVSVAFENRAVTIYAVDPDLVCESGDTDCGPE
ncbi:DUF2298 domain-containing protein [Halococcus salifodinae]|uniref:Chlor_Arch_YYY domain-containing protein n=1 Tax=Halococcus salifodinae DSM 8989 TaxID=1227456 RepID=M0N2N5_9EURY|nr:DUF2298 domain-containing protein [Halococcus salifodinae]EMA52207.1 hypothetical protein C450_11566 [Halococcus salifodinae DSM 8989]